MRNNNFWRAKTLQTIVNCPWWNSLVLSLLISAWRMRKPTMKVTIKCQNGSKRKYVYLSTLCWIEHFISYKSFNELKCRLACSFSLVVHLFDFVFTKCCHFLIYSLSSQIYLQTEVSFQSGTFWLICFCNVCQGKLYQNCSYIFSAVLLMSDKTTLCLALFPSDFCKR